MHRLFIFAIPLLVLAFACSDGETGPQPITPTAAVTTPAPAPTATATSTPEEQRENAAESYPSPPDVSLRVGGVLVSGKPGYYCWSESGRGICVQSIGLITSSKATTVSDGMDGVLELPGGLEATLESVEVWDVEGVTPLALPVPAFRAAWGRNSVRVVSSEDIAAERRSQDSEIALPLSTLVPEPGRYAVSLILQFEEGRVNYGFYVVVADEGDR